MVSADYGTNVFRQRSHLNCVVEDTEPFGCPNTHIPSIGLQGKKDTRHLRLFCLLNVKRGSYVQVIPRCLQYNMELGLYESKERKATCWVHESTTVNIALFLIISHSNSRFVSVKNAHPKIQGFLSPPAFSRLITIHR